MKLDKVLRQKFSEAEAQAKSRFEAQTIQPVGQGIVGVHAVGAFMDSAEFGEEVIDAYKGVFLEKGEDFTRKYLESRWRIANLFSKKYNAAREALKEFA